MVNVPVVTVHGAPILSCIFVLFLQAIQGSTPNIHLLFPSRGQLQNKVFSTGSSVQLEHDYLCIIY